MDVVSWDKLELREAISKELSVKDVIFSSPHSRSEDLQKEILMFCVKPQILSVDGQDFFKLFKINDNKIKILRSARKQVDTFNNIKISFDKQRLHFDKKDEPDLLFEFQAYMTDLITKAQKDMSEENEFTFSGDGAPNELGHLANMTNQLRAILYDIRIETLRHAANDHGVYDVRSCPHCGEVWALISKQVLR